MDSGWILGGWWGFGERVFERVFEGFCGLGVFERVLWVGWGWFV